MMKTCGEEPMNYGGSEKKKKERLERKIKIKKQGKASKLRASSPFSGVYLHFSGVS